MGELRGARRREGLWVRDDTGASPGNTAMEAPARALPCADGSGAGKVVPSTWGNADQRGVLRLIMAGEPKVRPLELIFRKLKLAQAYSMERRAPPVHKAGWRNCDWPRPMVLHRLRVGPGTGRADRPQHGEE